MMKFHNSIFFSFIAPRTSHLAPLISLLLLFSRNFNGMNGFVFT